MILRHRSPDGRNRDRDMGPGPVGNVRGAYQRTLGAVLLRDAVPPRLTGWNAIYEATQDRRKR